MVLAAFVMVETLPLDMRVSFSFRTSNPLSFVEFFGRSKLLLRKSITLYKLKAERCPAHHDILNCV